MRLTGDSPIQRYPAIEPASARERVLIVAPHMDDETIGAGGYAIDAIASGAEVYVVFMTAGDCARFAARLLNRTFDPGPNDFISVGRKRIREARAVMNILGIPRDRWFVLGYPDQGLRTMLERPSDVIRSRATGRETIPYDEALSPGGAHTLENILGDLQLVLEIARPDTVIAPVPFDSHPDHSASADLIERALDNSPFTANRLGYLIHSGRFFKPLVWMPDRAVLPPARLRSFTWASYDVSPAAQKTKYAMLQCYESQKPYTILLRNAFVRSNELFFAYAPQPVAVGHAPSFACVPYSSASSL